MYKCGWQSNKLPKLVKKSQSVEGVTWKTKPIIFIKWIGNKITIESLENQSIEWFLWLADDKIVHHGLIRVEENHFLYITEFPWKLIVDQRKGTKKKIPEKGKSI